MHLSSSFRILLLYSVILGILQVSFAQNLPTVYEYYSEGGIVTGLTANSLAEGFQLNGKPIRIFSASIHYFRVHPDYWRDRMKRARAAGILAIDTYIPWNLHEPQQGVYDFGDGGNDMSMFLNLRSYIQMAKEEDLLVVLRPGPYICAEWDFGGLPSWLLRDPTMAVRSSNDAYETRVKLYFDNLLPRVADLQWMNGGPIIMFQIENEYGVFGTVDTPHLQFLQSVFVANGLKELFFTCDSPIAGGDKGSIPGVLQTANFFTRPVQQLDKLLEYQPDKPIFIAEYWSGWFDHLLDPFHWTTTVPMFSNVMETVLDKYNGSINFYMFHGGTSYGFLAGANSIPEATGLEPLLPYYAPDISSYDYNAPLSEDGDYTEKYSVLRDMIEKYAPVQLNRPYMIPENLKITYPYITTEKYLSYEDILSQAPATIVSSEPTSMEMLPINNGNGQSFGYILYRIKNKVIGNRSTVQIGKVRDHATLLINGVMQNKPLENIANILLDFGYWVHRNQKFTLNLPTTESRTIDILVENMGRVNFGGPGDFLYQKGLHEGTVQIDGQLVTEFDIIPLEFKNSWVQGLQNWKNITRPHNLKGPILIQSTFMIDAEPQDTFLDMSHWHKGIVFVNGFNLGRYFKGGPATTTYVAAPFLKTGINTITIFEQYTPSEVIVFRDTPNLGKSLADYFTTTTTTTTSTPESPTTTESSGVTASTTEDSGAGDGKINLTHHVCILLMMAFLLLLQP